MYVSVEKGREPLTKDISCLFQLLLQHRKQLFHCYSALVAINNYIPIIISQQLLHCYSALVAINNYIPIIISQQLFHCFSAIIAIIAINNYILIMISQQQ